MVQERLIEWHHKASQLWQEDANNILALVDNYDVVVLNAPHASGKTNFLTPQLRLQAAGRWNIGYLDTSVISIGWINLLPDEPDIKKIRRYRFSVNKSKVDLKEGEKAAIILDEVGGADKYDLLRLVRICEGTGFEKFILFPAGATDEFRKSEVERITQTLCLIGKTSIDYDMGVKNFPEDLSREFLEIKGVPQNLIGFILAVFPRTPFFLSTLSHEYYRTEDRIRSWWEDSKTTLVQSRTGVYSSEEYNEIDQRILKA